MKLSASSQWLAGVLIATGSLLMAAPDAPKADPPKINPAPAKPEKPKRDRNRTEMMDYGPFLNLALKAEGVGAADNNTPKAVAIPLGENEKGEPAHAGAGQTPAAAVCFDEDLLRFSAGWVGGFIDYKGVTFHGDHGRNCAIAGTQKWATVKRPGWAKPGATGEDAFKDPRTDVSGPLPAEWAKFRGIYRDDANHVVLSYTVGKASVLERPGITKVEDGGDGEIVFRREFSIAPNEQQMVLNVVNVDKGGGKLENGLAVLTGEKGVTAVGLGNPPAGVRLVTKDGAIRLVIPPHGPGIGSGAGEAGVSFSVYLWSGAKEKFAAVAPNLKARESNYLGSVPGRGGPSIWKETVATKVSLGKDDQPYTVDTYEPPFNNPYKSVIRFGGFDFLPDGKSAVLSTWSGDVWRVSDISGSPSTVTWKRIASGLFEPLGLVVRNGEIFVHCRDGLWRLKDTNGDGEIDFYEVFNNDVHNNPFFHEFAFDLQADKAGNFYFAKAGPVNPGGSGFQRPMSENNGTLMKVSADGKYLEVIATGFRAPNGIGVNPETGQITAGDNEGTWVPKCPLHWITPGYFAGVVDTAHRQMKSTKQKSDLSERPKPICWFPKYIDNSGGGQTWVMSDNWGPFKGNLLHTSYGTCSLYNVMYEFVEGQIQGGVTKFDVKFSSGMNRPRFSPFDGQLYISGLTGWQSSGAKEAAFQRVRYTGKPVNMANGLHVLKDAVEITFTNPLDESTATDPGNWSVEQWNYEWAEHYGSGNVSVADPTKKGKDTLKDPVEITGVKLSADKKTVRINLVEVKPVMQMNIKYNIKAADGTTIHSDIFNTINEVPGAAG